MNSLFTERNVISLGKDLVADGTSEVTSAVEDMAGYDEITFLVKLGDVDAAAVMTFALKENTASHVSSPTPTGVTQVAGTPFGAAGVITAGNIVITEASGNIDDKIIVVTARHQALSKRYVFLSITATVESFEIDSIITIKSKARSEPVTQSSDVYAVGRAAA
jgi:hypothetical protein